MEKTQVDFLNEYFRLLREITDLLSKRENSIERQRGLYHLRSLLYLYFPAGDRGVGPTSFSDFQEESLREEQRSIFCLLSSIGTEKLSAVRQKEGHHVQEKRS